MTMKKVHIQNLIAGFVKIAKHRVALYGVIAFCLLYVSGCQNDVLDPTQIGRFRAVPVVNVILDSLGVVDEPDETYANTEEPRPEDVMAYERDYVLGTGDRVRLAIYELFLEGTTYIDDYIITETGRISIPEVGQVRAAGLTEAKLEEEIKDILSPGILKDPSVTVLLMDSQSRLFSIAGEGLLGRGGRVEIPRYDFRLKDALATVGGIAQFNVSNIYISREVTGEETEFVEPEKAAQPTEQDIEIMPVEPGRQKRLTPEEEIFELISPSAKNSTYRNSIIIASAEMITDEELEALAAPEGLEEQQTLPQSRPQIEPKPQPEQLAPQPPEQIEWVFEDGRWVPVRVGPAQEPKPAKTRQAEPLEQRGGSQYGWEQIGPGATQTRLIKIPVDKLYGGDAKYNIMIRPGDAITVPVDITGEFYVMGNANSTGIINLQGRRMTLTQAMAAAGGLGALAYPMKVEVIRRIGDDKEVIVLVDLDKIAKGLQPNFFIKPNDTINVGTHGTSRFLAVLRNAFRATYGFGFIYDRNFATRDFDGDPFPGHIGPLNDIF